MFIVRPDVDDEEADKLIAGFSTTVTDGGGVVKSVEKLGRRKLAYMVRKFNDGNYVLLTIEADGAVVLELERRSARHRAGDQVHHRAHGRGREAPGQGEGCCAACAASRPKAHPRRLQLRRPWHLPKPRQQSLPSRCRPARKSRD